jgi:hypothetical protein
MRERRFLSIVSNVALAFVCGCAMLADRTNAQSPPQRSVTQGRAKTVVENLYKCPVKVSNHRISAVGTITASNGTVLTVPAETAFQKGLNPKGGDLFNECNGVTPEKTGDVSAKNVSVVEVDRDGEEITGYIVADNYFELYVNGKLVAVDAVPYTPFNSVIVKFRAKRPITYAFKLVDWDENLGLGTELFGGNPWHPGDGGLIARFSDGTVTDSSWKAQSFYIAPLMNPDEVIEKGNLHDTTKLGRVHPVAKKPTCEDRCYAVHYPIPSNWAAPSFDDAKWPRAYEYTDTDIGVTNLPAYTRYPELFEGARWIWSLNLVFDNVVIARKTVK